MEYAVPLGDLINIAEEKEKLEEELKYQQGFLNSVLKKLKNERFVNNAPEQVVQKERQKQADAEIKIKAIEEQLNKLKN
jgi:valyl-tRNA synthetase